MSVSMSLDTSTSYRFVDVHDLADMLRRSRRTIERDLAAGRIGPRPTRYGQTRKWIAIEIEAWMLHGCPTRHEWTPIWDRIRSTHSLTTPTATATV